jgi:hypothetical protein
MKQLSNIKIILLLILLYSLIYFIYTFPIITEFSSKIIGDGDSYISLWNTYIFEKGIASGKPWTTNEVFYPWGTSLIYDTTTPIIGLFTLPFHNKILVINILLYIMFVASAAGGYFVSKQFIKSSLFAVVCGFIFAFSPYKMARIDQHYNLVLTGVIPFFFYFYLKAFSFSDIKFFPKINSVKYFILSLIFGIAGILCDYIIMFQMLYLSAIFLLFFYIYKFYKKSKKAVFWLLMFLVFLLGHYTIKWLVVHGFNDKAGLWWGGAWKDFLVPYNSWLYYGFMDTINQTFKYSRQTLESVMFLGYGLTIALILSLLFLLFNKNHNHNQPIKPIVFTLFVLFLITMPVIRLDWFGSIKTFYPPTAILHFVPVINNLRCPTRFINIIMLIAPIVVFYSLEQLKIRKFDGIIKRMLALILLVILFFEYFPNKYAYMDYFSIPKVYYELKDKPGKSVLVYPLGLRDGYKLDGRFDLKTMQYQTIHRKKVMGGYISRCEDWIWYVHYKNPFTNTLIQMEKDTAFIPPKADYIAAIKSLNLDYIIIPKEYKNEKAALFLYSSVTPLVTRIEDFDGSLLMELSH